MAKKTPQAAGKGPKKTPQGGPQRPGSPLRWCRIGPGNYSAAAPQGGTYYVRRSAERERGRFWWAVTVPGRRSALFLAPTYTRACGMAKRHAQRMAMSPDARRGSDERHLRKVAELARSKGRPATARAIEAGLRRAAR